MKRQLLMLVCAATVAASSARAAAPVSWIATWAAPPAPSTAASKSLENQTVRQVVRISAGGKRVRIRLSNEYGTKPLAVGAATIAHATMAGASTAIGLTFNGKASVIIPAGAPIYSDPVDLPVKALDALSVSLFFPDKTGPCTCHQVGVQTAYVSAPGDFTKTDFTPALTLNGRLFLTEVDVEPTAPTPVIIAFGDSITDGYRSTENANHRWPDILTERLGGKTGVAMEAISGNRVLALAGNGFGESALTRFDRDVLSVPGGKWIVVLEGVNDLGSTKPTPTVDDLLGGYRQIVDRAHARGLKVYGATILPYGGAAYYTADGEAVREAVNAWMRSKASFFDGLVDFDIAMRDPANPTKMRAELQSGDWLHPNDAGYKVMGDAVDLKLFRS
jgi:lysophospholipase L1-like esterase